MASWLAGTDLRGRHAVVVGAPQLLQSRKLAYAKGSSMDGPAPHATLVEKLSRLHYAASLLPRAQAALIATSGSAGARFIASSCTSPLASKLKAVH